jgi:putative aldouronate transport system permease protein
MVQSYESGLDKFNKIHKSTNAAFNIIFTICALACLVPVLLVISISFSAESSIDKYGYQLIPKTFSTEAYKYLLSESTMLFRAFGISIFVTVAGTIIGVVLTTSMGYVLSRPNYRLKKFLTWVVFIPMIFNGGLVSSYYVTATLLNLKNSVWVLILPLAVSSFNVIICKTFFRSTIPDSLIESAKIDGATQLKIYFKIVLPISMPVLATIGLFLCFAYWNDWYQSLLYIDDQSLYSLQALLNTLMNNIDYLQQNAATIGASASLIISQMPEESVRMAIAIIIVIPVACAYPFFQQYFVSGLTIGAVKG